MALISAIAKHYHLERQKEGGIAQRETTRLVARESTSQRRTQE
jgi:hypothetical protein